MTTVQWYHNEAMQKQ